jgi:hypothetical protein
MVLININDSFMTLGLDVVQAKAIVEFLRECTSNGKDSIEHINRTSDAMQEQGIPYTTGDVLGAIYSFNSVVAPWLEQAAAPVKETPKEQVKPMLMTQPGSEALN